MIGKIFSRLTVIEPAESDPRKNKFWKCQCVCGNFVTVRAEYLHKERTRSCGCLHREQLIQRNYKHGAAPRKNRGKLYTCWSNIKARCYNPDHQYFYCYGGKGITICEEWKHSFIVFSKWALANGYNPELTIDRIDNNGDYCPENCKWSTQKEQATNKTNIRDPITGRWEKSYEKENY